MKYETVFRHSESLLSFNSDTTGHGRPAPSSPQIMNFHRKVLNFHTTTLKIIESYEFSHEKSLGAPGTPEARTARGNLPAPRPPA